MKKVSQRITRLDPGGEQETVAQDAFLVETPAFFAFYLYRLSHVQLARDRVSLVPTFGLTLGDASANVGLSVLVIAKAPQSEISYTAEITTLTTALSVQSIQPNCQ